MAVTAFTLVAATIVAALVARPLFRAAFRRRTSTKAPRPAGQAEALPLVHHSVARSVQRSSTKREGLCRFEIESDLGAVAFDGPQDLRVKAGDAYSLALDHSRRPRQFTNNTLAATWDLPQAAPLALPDWLPGVPLALLGASVLAVAAAVAAMLAPWAVENFVAAGRDVFSEPSWLPESGEDLGASMQKALRQIAVVLSLAAVAGAIVTNRRSAHRVGDVPPLAIRDAHVGGGWIEVPPTGDDREGGQPVSRRKK